MIDEDLTPDEARRLRAHMDALPDSVEPARDLWPAIHDRIEAARVSALPAASVVRAVPSERARTHRPRWPVLAAAAVALVVVSVSLTLYVVRTTPSIEIATSSAKAASDAPPTASLASFASYERSAAELASALERRSSRLDPATRAVLERSLRTIDEAIAEARAALAADPASAAYQTFVEAAYRQKIDFLRRANDVAALQGP